MKNKLLLGFILFSVLGVCNIYGMKKGSPNQIIAPSNVPNIAQVQRFGLSNVEPTVRHQEAECAETERDKKYRERMQKILDETAEKLKQSNSQFNNLLKEWKKLITSNTEQDSKKLIAFNQKFLGTAKNADHLITKFADKEQELLKGLCPNGIDGDDLKKEDVEIGGDLTIETEGGGDS